MIVNYDFAIEDGIVHQILYKTVYVRLVHQMEPLCEERQMFPLLGELSSSSNNGRVLPILLPPIVSCQ